MDETNPSGVGGGLLIGDSVNVEIINCTFVNNSAPQTGGLMASGSANISILNTIFSENIPNEIGIYYWNESCPEIDLNFSLISGGIESVYFDTSTCNINWGDNNIDVDPLFCNSDSGNFSLAENSPAVGTGENGLNIGALGIGCDALSNDETTIVLPYQYRLYQNYPNPFNPTTTLNYDLPENAFVSIRVFDLRGRLITMLINSEQIAGHKAVKWAGVDNKGKQVPTGLYLYEIQAGDFRQVRKMVLLK